jgi:hypothetical protein
MVVPMFNPEHHSFCHFEGPSILYLRNSNSQNGNVNYHETAVLIYKDS